MKFDVLSIARRPSAGVAATHLGQVATELSAVLRCRAWADGGAVGMVRGADSVLPFVVTTDEAADVAIALDAAVAPLRRRRIEQLLAEAERAVAAIRTAVAAEPQYERGEDGLVTVTEPDPQP